MTKKEMIARLAELGIADDLSKKNAAELEALIQENDPSAGANSGGKDSEANGTGQDPRTGDLLEVRIEFSSEPGGREDVFACVNGYNFNAKRGQWMHLDRAFVEHLESCEVEDHEPVLKDGRPTGELVQVNRRRFQVSRKR